MHKPLLVLVSVFTLFACTDRPKSNAFLCDTQRVKITFHQNGTTALLKYNNQQHTLIQQPSASGAKYTHKEIVFWNKGNEAMLIINNNKYLCNLD